MLTKENIHQVFQSLPLPVLLLEPKGSKFVIVDVNTAYLKQISVTREALLGKENTEAFPIKLNNEADALLIQASLKEAVDERKTSKIEKIRYLLPTNETEERYWNIENIPVSGTSGEVEFIINISRDITEQELARQRHESESQRQRQVTDFIEENIDALFSLDRKGYFTSANSKILEALDVPLEKLLESKFISFCVPEDRTRITENFQNSLSGNATKFEANFLSLKGDKMILQIALMPLKIENRIEGVYGIAKDITGLRQTEKVVLEKKKFLEVNAAFISALLEKDLDYDLLEKAFSIIGKAIQADRMSFFEAHRVPDYEEVVFSKKAEWNSKPNSQSQSSSPLQNMPLSKVKQFLGPLFKNEPFFAQLSEMPEGLLKESFSKHNIRSLLLLPIFLQNKLYGYISFVDCHREKQWTGDDLSFLQGLSKNLTNALEKRLAEDKAREKEDQLRKNEQKFRALVQEGTDLMAILDAEGNYTFVSATVYGILGIKPEDVLGENVFQFIHPDDREKIWEQFVELKKSKKIKISPFRYSDKMGNWIWLETTATNLLEDPAVQGLVVNSRDVTTVLEQAQEIEHINERYRLAAMATQDIIYDWDLIKDRVKRYHNGPTKLFGFTEKDVNTRNFWRTHIHPSDFERVRTRLTAALDNPKENYVHTEYRFSRADGSYALVMDKAYILRDYSEKAVRIIGATSDISDIKAKEEALKIANERFKLAMDATNEMIYDWDIKSNVILRSQAYEDVYGYSLDEDHPANIFWFSRTIEQDRERVRNSLDQALINKDQYLWREEYAILRADNSVAHVIDRASLLRDEEGNATRMVGAVLDITQSLKLLKEVQKQNKVLREIAWEQSHVVRAPLARLKGLIYLLELQGFEENEQQKIIEHINASAEELDDIVKGIVAKTEDLE